MTIVPLGFNRVSVPLQTNSSYNNLNGSQLAMSRYEQQLMTERQYRYGSESPYNASAAWGVQAQMERKAQNAVNLSTTQNYLSATDSALSQIGSLANEARAAALDAINTLTSGEQQSVLAQTVKQVIQQIFDFGNNSYAGRYLFAGSTTSTLPFVWGTDSYTVDYRGSVANLYSWSDTDVLSQSGMNGVDVFGAISDPVRGLADLNPTLSTKTLLSDLNGGRGVDRGSIRLEYTLDNKATSIDVDLSRCVTLEDVERTLEKAGGPNFTLNVDLSQNGLVLSLAEGTPGTLTVSEVGKGTVARQLGIPTGTPITSDQSLQGRDLNPALTTTTLLSDILGSKANLTLRFAGANNDIVLQADNNGDRLNGVTVAIQADSNLSPGSEYAEYDPVEKRLLIHIHPDDTNANRIVEVVNEAAAKGDIPALTASLSAADQQRTDLAGRGIVSLLPGTSVVCGVTSGGSGEDFDPSGFQLVNGGMTHDISLEHCKTVGDLLAELNDPQYGLDASINDAGNGINIRSRVSGADFCIGENGGTTATQLGVRTTDANTRLEDLDYGRGVSNYDGPGTPAKASYANITPNSSMVLTARNDGSEWNDYTLRFVTTDDPQGRVTVSMDEDAKTVTIGINPGVTTACEVIAAFEEQPGPKQFFTLSLDDSNGTNTGLGVVYEGFAITSGGQDGGIDFTVTRNDGTVLAIDIGGAETIGDVLDLINGHSANSDGALVAVLAEYGNGIELIDRSVGDYTTRVDRALLSTAAVELGLIDRDREFREATAVGDGETRLTGNDPNPQETDSLFNALIRLQIAIEKDDTREIERATQLLDASIARLTESRSTIGVMQQSLDNISVRLSDEYVQHEETLNSVLRIDFAEVSINYMAQQLAYQATMTVTSSMFQMSLLNYL